MPPTFSLNVGRDQRKRRAITLVDLCVAVLILSIVSAITVPRMSEVLDRHKIEATSQLMVHSLNYLRNRAIIEGRDIKLVVSTEPFGLRCDQIAMPNQPGQTYFLDLSKEANITELSYEGISGPSLTVDRFGDIYDQGLQIEVCTITIASLSAIATVTISQNSIQAETSRR